MLNHGPQITPHPTRLPSALDEHRILAWVASDVASALRVALPARPLLNFSELAPLLAALDAGAALLVLDESTLASAEFHRLVERLAQQPDWSELPIIFLRTAPSDPGLLGQALALGRITALDWPAGPKLLAAAIGAAELARERQYRLRNQLLAPPAPAPPAEVTDQRAAQTLKHATELTQDEQRERQRLTHVLHGDVQQLLVAAKLGTARLRGRTSSARELRQRVDRVSSLLDQAIATTRALTAELSPPTLPEGGLAAVLRWLARELENHHRLRVHVSAEPAAEPLAEDVRVLLYLAARELLLKAARQTGTGDLWLSLERLPADRVGLIIQDLGSGLDDAGDQLGLFGIRERIELIGGGVTLSSGPGRSMRIVLKAPRRLPVPAERQRPSLNQPSPCGAAPSQDAQSRQHAADRIRVLLADDHAALRHGLGSMLAEYSDIEVIGEADDGMTAVELARRLQPDIILMDVTMPRLGGIEATRQIVGELPRVRVIGLSMHEEETIALAMREAGAVAYLAKCGDTDDLIVAIRNVTARC